MKLSELFLLGLIVLVALCLYLYGIGSGVPDESRIKLVFSDRQVVEQLTPFMNQSRDEIYQGLSYNFQPQNYQERSVNVTIDGNQVAISRTLLDAMRSYLLRSYDGDEQNVLVALSKINPAKLNFNPHFYSYGMPYIYFVGVGLKLADLFNWVALKSNTDYYYLHPGAMGNIFIAGRLVGVLGAVLAVLLMYFLGRKMLGGRAALIAASLLAVTPGVVFWAHIVKLHVFCLWGVILAFYFATRLLNSDSIKAYIWAGLLAGIATGIDCLCGFFVVAIPLAHVLRELSKGNNVWRASVSLNCRKIYFSLILFVLVIIVCNPYMLICWKEFYGETRVVQGFFDPNFTIINFINYFSRIIRTLVGTPLWLVVAGGLFYAIFSRKSINILILGTIIPFYLYMGATVTDFARQSIPCIPFLVLLAASFLDSALSRKKVKFIIIPLLAIIIAYNLLYCFAYDRVFATKNVRTIAGEWIVSNIKEGATIGMPDTPAPWRTPPINPLKYRLIITAWDREIIEQQKPDYFIVSEIHLFGDATHQKEFEILSNYKEIKRIETPTRILGLTFSKGNHPTNDWVQLNPVILIFKRL
jgi:hypothetical protein